MKFWGKTWKNHDKRAKSKLGGYQSRNHMHKRGSTLNAYMCIQGGGRSKNGHSMHTGTKSMNDP